MPLLLSIRAATLLSRGLALAGLSGVVTGNMALRNVGIAGYVGVFLIVAALLAVHFHASLPAESAAPSGPRAPGPDAR